MSKNIKTTPTEQQLKDAIVDISFEMNRYIYTAYPIRLPGRYNEVVAESCLLHSRTIGEFFFEAANKKDDIRITHYYDELISKDALQYEIEKSRSNWESYKTRTNKKLCHLTFARIDTAPMNMLEDKEVNFDVLIKLFEVNLPPEYLENWIKGKSYSV